MRPRMNQSLARRITAALAVAFSFTALGLNACLLLWPRAPEATASRHPPVSRTHSPRQMPQVLQTRIAPPAAAPVVALEPLDAAIQRFGEASDAELPKLAEGLARRAEPRAREALRVATRSTRVAVRSAAFGGLATLDSDDVRDFMLAQLNGPDAGSSVGYFADCVEPRAMPALERLAREGTSDLRRAALDALAGQGEIAEPLAQRLLGSDDETSDAVLDTRPLTVSMRRALRRASISRVRSGAITTGSAFVFLEQDLSNEARESLVVAAQEEATTDRSLAALATRGDRASLEALSRLAKDSDPSLAARAACAFSLQPDSRTRRFTPLLPQRGI